ncbi:MAG: hypothetical protein GY898_31170 [Proteobacteria bacterium]|nr:hypothetical protein [Pseudomonadota bacterium]
MRRSLPLAVAVALIAGCASDEIPYVPPSEPAVIRAMVESAHVVPGKPFFLTVETDVRQDVTLDLPDVGASIEGLVLLDLFEDTPEVVGDRVLTAYRYKLRAPIEGTYLIPGVEGPYKTEDLQVGTVGSGPILVEATRLGTTEEELRDLKPAIAPPASLDGVILAGFGLAALLLIIGLLLRLRSGRTEEAVPIVPPHEAALRELDRLARSGLLTEEDQSAFAYTLSGILRRYLEGRFDFGAWRMTTPEVMRQMPPELARDRKLEAAVRQVLEASDYVKFAGQVVPVPTLEGWISEARGVVHATKPRPEADV